MSDIFTKMRRPKVYEVTVELTIGSADEPRLQEVSDVVRAAVISALPPGTFVSYATAVAVTVGDNNG